MNQWLCNVCYNINTPFSMKCTFCNCYYNCKNTIKQPSKIATEGDEKIWKVVKNLLHSSSAIIKEVENENIFRKEDDRVNKRDGMILDVLEIKNMLNENLRNSVYLDELHLNELQNNDVEFDSQFTEQIDRYKSIHSGNNIVAKSVLQELLKSSTSSLLQDNNSPQITKSISNISTSSSFPPPPPTPTVTPPLSSSSSLNNKQKRQSMTLPPLTIPSLPSSKSTSPVLPPNTLPIPKSFTDNVISTEISSSSSTSSLCDDLKSNLSIPAFNIKEIPSPLHLNRSIAQSTTPKHVRKSTSIINTIPSNLIIPNTDNTPVTLTLDQQKQRLRKKALVKYKYNIIPKEFDSNLLCIKDEDDNSDDDSDNNKEESEDIYNITVNSHNDDNNKKFKFTFTKKSMIDEVQTPFNGVRTKFSFKEIDVFNASNNNSNNYEYDKSCEVIQILSSQILANILSDISVYLFIYYI